MDNNQKKFKRIIQLELNEISKDIIDHFIQEHGLKHFHYIDKLWFYNRTNSEAEYKHIEPWIVWISAHTGKSFSEHKVFHLGDCDQLKIPQIWEVLEERGVTSYLVGCMNATKGSLKSGLFFPDPWAKNGKTYPTNLQPAWDLISRKVQNHATSKISWADMYEASKVIFKLGVSFKVIIKIVTQIISQKIDRKRSWKLAALFDLFLFEIFNTLLKKHKQGYFILFLNSMAHYQHHYWRQFQPEKFNNQISTPDCHPSDNPILFGGKIYDKIIGKLLEFAKDPDTLVIITSGFEQEPYLQKEQEGGMNYYRLNDHKKFTQLLGLNNIEVYPMMSRDWQIKTDNVDNLFAIKSTLDDITVNGENLFKTERNSETTLFIETAITRLVDSSTKILSQNKEIGKFNELFTRTAVKSGHHVSEGSLYTSHKLKEIGAHSLPITKLFDLILDNIESEKNI